LRCFILKNKNMLVAIDVYYLESGAKSVAVVFDWHDAAPQQTHIVHVSEVAEYESGQFYKRELPCILAVLEAIDLTNISAIIVDGHVYIDNDKNYGLGAYLWAALGKKIPIIGVAKRSFHATEAVTIPILRGQSETPLFVSTIGIATEIAAEHVRTMHGAYRMPTVLKALDGVTRTI
jgi:deoxyribonuclease V